MRNAATTFSCSDLELNGDIIMLNIFYLIIVLTVLFAILNIVIIFRFVGGIIEGVIIIGIIWVLLVFNNVDSCPYLVGNCYFNLTR